MADELISWERFFKVGEVFLGGVADRIVGGGAGSAGGGSFLDFTVRRRLRSVMVGFFNWLGNWKLIIKVLGVGGVLI
jgi:hypothetical protein